MRHISRKGEDHPGQRVSMRGYWPRGPGALAVVLACGLVLCTSLAGAARAAAPEFDANLPTTLSMAENSAIGTNVGSPFTASDADNDTLSYSLEGTDRDNFRISNTGQLSTDAHLDYEAKTSHSVTLKVSAGTESDTHDVTINIDNQSDTGDSSLNPSGSDPTVARKSRATYSIRILGSWNRGVTPEGVPSGDHFTTFVGGIHNDQVTFLQDGQTASSGVESMAEVGGTSRLQSEVNAQKPNADRAVTFGAPSVTGTRTHTGVTFTSDHPRITLTSMIAPSPDWFVGVSGRSLLNSSGNWLDSLTVNLYPWDAGTENGTEFSLSNPSTNPRGVITSIRGLGKFTGEHIAQLTFTRTGSVELAPAAPTGFGVSASDRAVTLNWDLPSASGISRHEYRRKTTGGYGSWTSIPNSAPSESNEDSFTVSPLENDTEYTFQLRAVNSLGNGDASGEMSATPIGVANAAPSFSSSSTFDVDENTTGVATVVASDADDEDEVTSYEITGGVDRSRFSIGRTTGALAFSAAPNFESPADVSSSDPVNAGGNNEYLLVVTAKSGTGAREMSAQQSITVTVRDVNEPPVIPARSTFDVDENTTGVGTVVASDVDAGDEVTSYEITDGADRSRFSILRTTGALVFNAAPNFESPADVSSSDPVNAGGNNEYLLVVTAKSGSGAREMSAQQSIIVTVRDVNEPPVIPARSTFDVDENTTGVGTVVASDVDAGDEVTSYEITDGADRSRFSIGRTTGALVFDSAPNFESPADVASSDPVNAGGNNEYLLVVTAKSGSGAREMSAQQSIIVTVRDVNEPPVIPARSTFDVDENTTGVGTVVARDVDAGDEVTSYEITDGADRSRFSIGRTTGALVFNAAPNFESPADVASSDPVNAGGNNEYLVVVTAKSGSGAREMSAQQSITVTVLDVNEPPVMPATSSFGVDENTTAVGTVVASDADDEDDVTSYEITDGADRSRFSILRTTGALVFNAAPNFESPADVASSDPVNAGGNNEYLVVVTAKSGTGAREMSAQQSITVTVRNVNEPPGRPAAPTLSASTSTSLTVAWTAPGNLGAPDITGYDLQYMETSEISFRDGPQNQTGTSASITGLEAGTEYQVQVRASNAEGDSRWSEPLTASTQSALPVNLSLSLSDAQISENGGSATITASLDRASSASTTVTISATPVPPAVAADYLLSSNRELTIAAGSLASTGTVTLTAVDNDIDGPDKTVTIRAAVTSDAEVSDPASLRLLIEDEDTRGVTVSASRLDIDEGETGTFAVVLDSQPTGVVRVRPVRESGDTDITPSGALSFTADNWDRPQTVRVTAAEDADAADDSAVIGHRVGGADYASVTASSVAVTATDNDLASTGVTLSLTPMSVGEAAGATPVTVTASLSDGARTLDSEIRVSVGSGTASAGSDFAEVEEFVIRIAANSQSGTGEFSLLPTDDALYETDETVQVMGSSSEQGLAVRGASITIEDDDEAPPLTVRAVPDKALTLGQGSIQVNLEAFFGHPDGDALTYAAESSVERIVALRLDGSGLIVTPVAIGVAEIRVIAKDTDGSGEQGSVEFQAVVALEERRFSVNPNPDDAWTLTVQGRSGPVRITLPPGQGRMALDSDGDGDVDAADIEEVVTEVDESRVPPAPQGLDVDENSAVDIKFANPPAGRTLICLSTQWDSAMALLVARFNASTNQWEWLPSDVADEDGTTSVCAETRVFSVFAVLDGTGRDVSLADVNANAVVEADDALVMYYAFAFPDLLGDSSGGGVVRFRRALLGDALPGSPSDTDLRELLRRANQWRDMGMSFGGDLNGDAAIDEQDALVMYYAYQFEDRLGNGETGGDPGLRQRLLGGLAGFSDADDATLRRMLRRANSIRRAL